jgi:hypothetical protein
MSDLNVMDEKVRLVCRAAAVRASQSQDTWLNCPGGVALQPYRRHDKTQQTAKDGSWFPGCRLPYERANQHSRQWDEVARCGCTQQSAIFQANDNGLTGFGANLVLNSIFLIVRVPEAVENGTATALACTGATGTGRFADDPGLAAFNAGNACGHFNHGLTCSPMLMASTVAMGASPSTVACQLPTGASSC